MSDVTIGQIAYDAYHNCPESKLLERSTIAPLPFNHLSVERKAFWEAIAKSVKDVIAPGVGTGSGWIGVDLDGTLAEYHGSSSHNVLGTPIKPVIEHVRRLLAEGVRVKIFTARVSPITDFFGNVVVNKEEREKIEQYCVLHLGRKLEITCCKDYGMIELIDDRAIQVVPNRGIRVDKLNF